MQSSTIISIDKDGVIQSVDKNCCKMFGYDLEELIGAPVKVLIPAPYKEQHDTYIQTYHQTHVPKIIGKSRVVEGQHKDGSIFPIRLSVSKVGEGDDMIFIGMIDKLEDTSASITINSQGTVVSCNQAVEDLFGLKPNELIGSNVNVIMPSPHREKHDQYILNYLKGGVPKVIGKVRNVPARHKDGHVFPISLQVEQLKVGPILLFRGKIEKVQTIEAVFTIDDNGIIVSCNQNFVLPLFGYTTPELLGQNISILIPEIHQRTLSNEIERDSKRQKVSTSSSSSSSSSSSAPLDSSESEPDSSFSTSWKLTGVHRKELKHKDGSIFPVHLEIFPFSADGKNLYHARISRVDPRSEEGHHDSDGGLKTVGDYYVAKTVGQGSYGKVKLAFHKDNKDKKVSY